MGKKETGLDTSTPEATKKSLLKKAWNRIPPWLRIVAVIVSLIASSSPALPWDKIWDFINPPPEHFVFSCKTLNNGNPLETKLRLIGEKGNIIVNEASDSDGFAVFNILKNEKVIAVECFYNGEWKKIKVDDDVLKDSQDLIVHIENSQIDFK